MSINYISHKTPRWLWGAIVGILFYIPLAFIPYVKIAVQFSGIAAASLLLGLINLMANLFGRERLVFYTIPDPRQLVIERLFNIAIQIISALPFAALGAIVASRSLLAKPLMNVGRVISVLCGFLGLYFLCQGAWFGAVPSCLSDCAYNFSRDEGNFLMSIFCGSGIVLVSMPFIMSHYISTNRSSEVEPFNESNKPDFQ